jgi:uncharacterized damage-inducible protein DinB
MDVIASLTRQFAYNAWANRQTLESLRAARSVPPRAAEVMAHLLAAEWVWLRRLGQSGPELAVWPALPLEECGRHLRDLSQVWRSYLGGLKPDDLGREVAYTNSKGERWANTVSDILAHLALHGPYHRGQIALLLGRAGEKPAHTDFIECVRRGQLDRGWPDEPTGV